MVRYVQGSHAKCTTLPGENAANASKLKGSVAARLLQECSTRFCMSKSPFVRSISTLLHAHIM